MCAVEVVIAQLLLQVALEAVSFGTSERAKLGRALLEDRLLETLDMAVRLWAAGTDAPLLDAQALQPVIEVSGAKLGAVIGDDRFQPPAGAGELGGDPFDERAAVLAGIAWRGVELGPGEAGGDIDRGVLPDCAFVPERRPT